MRDKEGFGNFFEEYSWQKFKEEPTLENREVWREGQELNEFLKKEHVEEERERG